MSNNETNRMTGGIGCSGKTLNLAQEGDSATLFLPGESGSALKAGSALLIDGCRYEGIFMDYAHSWTDLDPASPAYGGTFCLPLKEPWSPERGIAARDEQRRRFAAARQEVAA